MDDGFPKIPQPYQYVKFDKEWGIMNQDFENVPMGTIGQVLSTAVVDGYDHDLASDYILYIGVIIKEKLMIVKFPYNQRPDVISVIPDTPAGRVLFGKKDSP